MAIRLKLPNNVSAPAVVADLSIYRGSIWGSWSLRKFRYNSPTSPITLQRSSDNAVLDFALDGTGWIDTAAIATWAGAGTAGLLEWRGIGPKLSQATNLANIYTSGAAEVENGRPTFRMPSTNGGYTSPTAPWTGSGVTVFAVARLNTGVLASSQHVLFRIGDAAGAGTEAVGVYLRSTLNAAAGVNDGDGHAFSRGRNATTGQYITQSAGIASGLLAQHAVAIDATAAVWKRNGVALPARAAVAGVPLAMSTPVINVGRSIGTSTVNMLGSISELIVYNERLSDSQIADITADQREKFAIA